MKFFDALFNTEVNKNQIKVNKHQTDFNKHTAKLNKLMIKDLENHQEQIDFLNYKFKAQAEMNKRLRKRLSLLEHSDDKQSGRVDKE